jgi:hypothetical protein
LVTFSTQWLISSVSEPSQQIGQSAQFHLDPLVEGTTDCTFWQGEGIMRIHLALALLALILCNTRYAAVTCFKTGEKTSGMNKICF